MTSVTWSLKRGGGTGELPRVPATLIPSAQQTEQRLALETGRNRLIVITVVFALLFSTVVAKLIDLSALQVSGEPAMASESADTMTPVSGRSSIVDRNGFLLAAGLPTVSLYANPRDLRSAGETPELAADKILSVLPDADPDDLVEKLSQDRAFVYLRRNLTPKQQYALHVLGIPGLYFENSERRIYPHGRLIPHVIGLTDIDGNGIAGIEASFDTRLRSQPDPLMLSIDTRLQQVMRQELSATIEKFHALGAAGLILDAHNGEVLSLVSLPDFDPNLPATLEGDAAFNRVTKGVYEMGSTFKLFNTALALDSGKVRLDQRYDARQPLKVSRFVIRDFHGKNRWLTIPEILVHSSNIGSALMAKDIGGKIQRDYLGAFGLLQRPPLEIPEVGTPLSPDPWREINAMTISYGHGVAVTPLQVASAVAALVNGGVLYPSTLLRHPEGVRPQGKRVISETTSDQMRALMRLVVREGTGGNADVEGYLVGGKTGTADKPKKGRYGEGSVMSSFVAAFPMNAPRYVVLVMVDEPQGIPETFGYTTGGWVAAPSVRRIIERFAPMYGLAPLPAVEPDQKDAAEDKIFVPVKLNL